MDYYTTIFWNVGLSYTHHKPSDSHMVGHRVFKTFYGVSPNVCASIWSMITDKPQGCEQKHLLWALLFLKRYNTESINAAIVGVSEKTFREWTWQIIDLLAALNLVHFLLLLF